MSEGMFTRDEPRDPHTWPRYPAQPVPEWTVNPDIVGRAVRSLVKALTPGLVAHAKVTAIHVPPEFADLTSHPRPATLVELLRDISFHHFPGRETTDTAAQPR